MEAEAAPAAEEANKVAAVPAEPAAESDKTNNQVGRFGLIGSLRMTHDRSVLLLVVVLYLPVLTSCPSPFSPSLFLSPRTQFWNDCNVSAVSVEVLSRSIGAVRLWLVGLWDSFSLLSAQRTTHTKHDTRSTGATSAGGTATWRP